MEEDVGEAQISLEGFDLHDDDDDDDSEDLFGVDADGQFLGDLDSLFEAVFRGCCHNPLPRWGGGHQIRGRHFFFVVFSMISDHSRVLSAILSSESSRTNISLIAKDPC